MNLFEISKPLMNSPAVTRLQEQLASLGYDLGRHGPDGVYGEDTAAAVRAFQRAAGLAVTGKVDAEVTAPQLDAALKAREERAIAIVDRRGLHAPPQLYAAKLSPRAWTGEGENVIRGVTLHQTGCLIADRPQRWDTLNAHIGVLRDGTIVLVNPLESFIWHAQGLSHATIGIEFNGAFEGVAGRADTRWAQGALRLTPEQLRGAELLLGWLKEQFATHGGTWTLVHAHRQSYAARCGDPGSEIWQKVGLPWIAALGGSDGGAGWKVGTGRPIPREWNEQYDASY